MAETINDVDPLSGEIQLKQFAAKIEPSSAAFVKIVAQNIGKCPKGHTGEGKAAWFFVDEILVE